MTHYPKKEGTFKVDQTKVPPLHGYHITRFIVLIGVEAEGNADEVGKFLSALVKEKFDDGWVYMVAEGDQKPDEYRSVYVGVKESG